MSPVHHVLGEHVGDDGLLHGQHLSDDDVAASDGEAPPAVFVLEGDGVAHHGVEGVLVGHVWQLGSTGGWRMEEWIWELFQLTQGGCPWLRLSSYSLEHS